MKQTNHLAVIVAVIVHQIVGYVWYGVLFHAPFAAGWQVPDNPTPRPTWMRLVPCAAKPLPPLTNRSCVRPPAVTRTCAPMAAVLAPAPRSTNSTQWRGSGRRLR